MKIRFIDNPQHTIDRFIENFVMPWDEFRDSHREWIEECAQQNFPIDINWYNSCHFWYKATADFEYISFQEALSLLNEVPHDVIFTAEKDKTMTFHSTDMQNFAATRICKLCMRK